MRRSALVTFPLALGLGVALGCGDGSGPSSQLEPMSWSSTVHECGSNPILTVATVLGPPGARIGNMIPGRYVVRGSYNLAGQPAQNYVIDLVFLGSYVTGSGNRVGEDRNEIVPSGQTSGSYEVVQEILEWTEGAGNPVVEIFPGIVVQGSAYDCIRVLQ